MSIEDAIMGGIVFKGKKDKPREEEKDKKHRTDISKVLIAVLLNR